MSRVLLPQKYIGCFDRVNVSRAILAQYSNMFSGIMPKKALFGRKRHFRAMPERNLTNREEFKMMQVSNFCGQFHNVLYLETKFTTNIPYFAFD